MRVATLFLTGWLLVAGCVYAPPHLSLQGDTPPPGDGAPTTGMVQPLYPFHGGNWLDYVGGSPTASILARADEPCAYTWNNVDDDRRYHSCAHGGELRRFDTELTTCTGVAADDDLSAFTWECYVGGNGRAFLVTSGLHPTLGLNALIDPDVPAFHPNRVVVKQDGVVVAQSEPAVWWQNQVVPAPDSSTETRLLDESGTIYVVAASAASEGYNLDADRVALVVARAAWLKYTGSGINNCDTWAAPTNPTMRCFIAASSRSYLWIEGAFDGGDDTGTVLTADTVGLHDTHFSVLRNVSAQGGGATGLWLSSSDNNSIAQLGATRGGPYGVRDYGVELWSSRGNDLAGVRVRQVGGGGVDLLSSDGNRLVDTRVWQVGGNPAGTATGMRLENSSDNRVEELVVAGGQTEAVAVVGGASRNVLVGVHAANNLLDGVWIADLGTSDNTVTNVVCTANHDGCLSIGKGASGTTVSHVTAGNDGALANEGTGGVGVLPQSTGTAPTATTLNQVAVVNGGDAGILIDAVGTQVSQVAVGQSGVGVKLVSGTTVFRGNLILGGNEADCKVTPGAVGLTDLTCAPTGESAVLIMTGQSLAAAFVAEALSDSHHALATNGKQAFAEIDDWVGFDNFYRGWGGSEGAFPATTLRSPCATGMTCQIWDWRLRAGTTNPLLDRSADARYPNGAFVGGEACPAAVQSDQAVTDAQASPQTFLMNAVEVMGDGVGDDDGLCEKDEHCLYSPNFGAYQGEGDWWHTDACLFQEVGVVSGEPNVTGVTLYGFPDNGVP